MTARRRQLVALPLALLALGGSVVPAALAESTSGGATPGVVTLPGSPPIVVHVGNPLASASAGGITISVHTTALLHGRARVSGSAPRQAGGTVSIERLDASGAWATVATAAVAGDGAFAAIWRPDRVGTIELRALPGGDPATTTGGAGTTSGSAGTAAATPQIGVTVYRAGVASWYGGKHWSGHTTACGIVLGRATLGVAHRTLPCGTPVALYYRGRTLVVPVIDRGPYVAGRSWDLTRAVARALGTLGAGVVTLGALAQPVPAPAAAAPAPPAAP